MHFERIRFGYVVEPPDIAQQLRARHLLARGFRQPPEQREFARMEAEPATVQPSVAVEQVEQDGAGLDAPRETCRLAVDPRQPRIEFDMRDLAGKRIAQPVIEQPRAFPRIVDADRDDPPACRQVAPVARPAGRAPVEQAGEPPGLARVGHRPVRQPQIPPHRNNRAGRQPYECRPPHESPLSVLRYESQTKWRKSFANRAGAEMRPIRMFLWR